MRAFQRGLVRRVCVRLDALEENIRRTTTRRAVNKMPEAGAGQSPGGMPPSIDKYPPLTYRLVSDQNVARVASDGLPTTKAAASWHSPQHTTCSLSTADHVSFNPISRSLATTEVLLSMHSVALNKPVNQSQKRCYASTFTLKNIRHNIRTNRQHSKVQNKLPRKTHASTRKCARRRSSIAKSWSCPHDRVNPSLASYPSSSGYPTTTQPPRPQAKNHRKRTKGYR